MFSELWFPLVTLCCTVWISWLLITNISNWAKAGPPLPPGPKGLPVVGMLPFLDPQLHTYFARLARAHGPLLSLRLGYKIAVVVSSPSAAKQLLKDFDVVFANHDILVSSKEFAYGGNDLTFSPYGAAWRTLRKVSVSGMLGPLAVDAVSNLRKQWLSKTILHIHRSEGKPINIGEEIFVMVLNMITSMLWGGAVTGTKWVKEGPEFRREVIKALDLLATPNVSDFFPWLARFDLQGVAKKMRDSTKRLDAMVTAIINERKQVNERKGNNVDEYKDFLQFLLELMDNGDARTQLTMDQLKGLLIFFITSLLRVDAVLC
ncbi:hypothetical protein V2J09_010343 [Rumex salicifolius]